MGSFLPKIFNDIENTDIYKAALDCWGESSQILMLVEETGEMLSALSQFSRGRITLDELIEEMIDTLMMIDEMFHMLGVSTSTHILADFNSIFYPINSLCLCIKVCMRF